MKKIATLTGIAVVSLGILAGCGGDKPANNSAPSNSQTSSQSSTSSNTAATGSVKEVKVEGTNYKIEVQPVEIKAGDKVKLTFATKEGMHGYSIKNTSVKADQVGPGMSKTVEWTPDKPGEYEVFCNTICGPTDKHTAMTAKIVVK
ncbi:cupredoxin domain-containing protein [Effusibacillus lacus]|uniref:EfeO-type cupredoxin-like domain-containing protein n=1 Tax=Effusibacillus lacus TaxID=1348429 RepID=A0A292YPL2_9BACL|nr:cupredoxin domain-containing protein [Effusibacillus lacus]TCS74150.1 lipoprotein antigen [Effusibacillus lacus]GAX90851.1 hypothetical protein EFBL_2493 [Effusibacillus lacus]